MIGLLILLPSPPLCTVRKLLNKVLIRISFFIGFINPLNSLMFLFPASRYVICFEKFQATISIFLIHFSISASSSYFVYNFIFSYYTDVWQNLLDLSSHCSELSHFRFKYYFVSSNFYSTCSTYR